METASSSQMEFDDHGFYSPLPDIDLYWRIEGFGPLLIHVRQQLAGFILINTRSHRGGTETQHEFFVARKHRRCGVATEAVRQIWALYPALGLPWRAQCRLHGILAACYHGGAQRLSACPF